jgi:flagellar hook-associated protein 1 FlgK
MNSLSSVFDLARGSLVADQEALSVTGNNIANQNVAGYTRQIAKFSGGDTVTLSGGAQVATSAPTVTAVSVRNLPLVRQVQAQTQAQASSSAQAGVLAQMEAVFSITGSATTAGSTQLGTALDGLFSSFTALAGNPADAPTQQGALAAAQTVAAAFNAAASQLDQVTASTNSDVGSAVSEVNSLTAAIAGLNARIGANAADAAPNADAGALEDQRQAAITQLSQYVGLDQIRTEQNGISLTTTGGTSLVSGSQAFALNAVAQGSGTRILANGSDVTATVAGGSIGGDLAALATNIPAVSSSLDALAYRVATAVNTQNAAGVDGSGNPGGPIFSVPATVAGAAAAITVSATHASAFASAATGEGSAGNTNANALVALRNQTDTAGETISGNLATLLGTAGSTSSELSQQSTNQQTTLTQLTSALASYSGVNLDDEAANLSTYQKSYEASAKLFSVLNSIYADAINLGTQTTVA